MTTNEKVRFTLRLTKPLFDILSEKSKEQGISINSLILKILWDWKENNIG